MNPELPTIALSIRQPWAWLIVNGYKDIENRSRCIKDFLGPVLIHASSACPLAEYNEAYTFMEQRGLKVALRKLREAFPEEIVFQTGGIVGVAHIHGHGNFEMVSPWWVGPYSYQLKDAKPLPFKPCKGRLGFFPIDYNALP